MIYIPDAMLDQWLLEDIQGGDITIRALGIGSYKGRLRFIHRQGGCVSGMRCAQRLLQRLNLEAKSMAKEGDVVAPGSCLLSASGQAAQLHQGWKVAQNLLEWSCGIADYTYRMRQTLLRHAPAGQIAGTRKTFPGTRLLAWQALLAGGGILHRCGLGETVLLFANHRRFYRADNWPAWIERLRQQAPEKAIVVEADNKEEALAALVGRPDVLQLDKFTLADIGLVQQAAARLAPDCRLALAGGITLATLDEYARTGIGLMITSAPYAAPPADIAAIVGPH